MGASTSLTLTRNMVLGGAAVCLAVLLGILQIGASDDPLQYAVFGSAIGMPSFFCAAAALEMALSFDPRADAWLLTPFGRTAAFLPAFFGSVGVMTAMGGVLYHLSPVASLATT